MAEGNRVFRAKTSFFIGRIKVAAGALVREGHEIMKGTERHFEELKIDFEREDLKAQKAAKAAAAKAEAEAKAKADEAAKQAVVDAAKAAESDAAKVVADDGVKAVEADVEKAGK